MFVLPFGSPEGVEMHNVVGKPILFDLPGRTLAFGFLGMQNSEKHSGK